MSAQEIIAAPFTVWIAPAGTAFPKVDEQPGEDWVKIGTRGDRSYSPRGVSVQHVQSIETAQPAGSISSSWSFHIGQELRVALELFDCTLEQYSHALGENSVRDTVPELNVGYRTIGLSVRPRSQTTFCILVRGPSPYLEAEFAQLELPRCREAGAGARPVFGGSGPVGLSLEFVALEDPAAEREDELLGRLVAADEPARDDIENVVSLTQFGATLNASGDFVTGQYEDGAYWILGPVTVTAFDPPSTTQTSGTDGNGNPITSRPVHGVMVNPGNRSFASGGLTANNTGNSAQGLEGLIDAGGAGESTPYDASLNQDPGATGSNLVVTTGTILKHVSALTDLPTNNRPAGLDQVLFTVVGEIPPADAIRPGISGSDKDTVLRRSHIDVSVFQNYTATASTPSKATVMGWVERYIEASQPDYLNNLHVKGINNAEDYGRDTGSDLHRTLLWLNTDQTDEDKLDVCCRAIAICNDFVSRAVEGGITEQLGGGNAFKKPLIACMGAALGANRPASWTEYLDKAQQNVWAEDRSIFRVTGRDVDEARYTGDGRTRDAYDYRMISAREWGAQAIANPDRSGSNWDVFYRDVIYGQLLGGVLAVKLTTGAEALWNNADFFRYMETARDRRAEAGAGNGTLDFVEEMIVAHWPALSSAPTIEEAGVRDDKLWVRFNQALDKDSVPANGDFTVNVGGSPVSLTGTPIIFRQNVGLTLASAPAGTDTVTVDYAAGTNPVRNVDEVDAADFTGQAVTNYTEKTGGPSAAYPVVELEAGTILRPFGNQQIASNSRYLTCYMGGFRFDALPAATTILFGQPSGFRNIELVLNTDGTLALRTFDASYGLLQSTTLCSALSANTSYEIMFSLDVQQTTTAAGIDCYVDGVAQTPAELNWSGGASKVIGWGNSVINDFGSDNTDIRIGAFWLDTAARLDLSSATNRDKFTDTTGGSLDIGSDGSGITESQPPVFLVGNAAQWGSSFGINRGSAPRFHLVEGGATDISGEEWGLPVSLFTTADFTEVDDSHSNILSATSFEAWRDGTGNGRIQIAGLTGGSSYRITGAVAGLPGFTTTFQVYDPVAFSLLASSGADPSFDETVTLGASTTTLEFRPGNSGNGYTFTDFFIEAA